MHFSALVDTVMYISISGYLLTTLINGALTTLYNIGERLNYMLKRTDPYLCLQNLKLMFQNTAFLLLKLSIIN